MNDIFIVCHPAGASYIKGMNVYSTEGAQKSILSGSTGATTQGLFAAFGADFHGGDDTAAITNTVSGKVQLAGVDFEVIDRGESYDLAIPSMNVVYTHMLGKKPLHFNQRGTYRSLSANVKGISGSRLHNDFNLARRP